ncbi:type II toxin-antitoxin system RatA family toxin [Halococcoides cellulosivorans]|uniref:type II toxin-antitoxin system RatA family toxin n=1 Tax=Halococcoides cellulosivorans TaxID=1679096 RepID=UPI001F214833|nr:SRPBCC family protein [Halococcoides cellulosivorans]
MPVIEARTVVRAPPDAVFDLLVDFPGYAGYSEYLQSVDRRGSGGAGTRYRLEFGWWRFSYAVRSEVLAVERPHRIDWQIVDGLDAQGFWRVEDASDAREKPASRIVFRVSYAPGTADLGRLDLPRVVSLETVVDRLRPVIEAEVERVVERVVADLEGTRRSVSVTVETDPDG